MAFSVEIVATAAGQTTNPESASSTRPASRASRTAGHRGQPPRPPGLDLAHHPIGRDHRRAAGRHGDGGAHHRRLRHRGRRHHRTYRRRPVLGARLAAGRDLDRDSACPKTAPDRSALRTRRPRGGTTHRRGPAYACAIARHPGPFYPRPRCRRHGTLPIRRGDQDTALSKVRGSALLPGGVDVSDLHRPRSGDLPAENSRVHAGSAPRRAKPSSTSRRPGPGNHERPTNRHAAGGGHGARGTFDRCGRLVDPASQPLVSPRSRRRDRRPVMTLPDTRRPGTRSGISPGMPSSTWK